MYKPTAFIGEYFMRGDINISYPRLRTILKKGDLIYGFSKKICHFEWLTVTHVDWWGVFAVAPNHKGHLKIKWHNVCGIKLK